MGGLRLPSAPARLIRRCRVECGGREGGGVFRFDVPFLSDGHRRPRSLLAVHGIPGDHDHFKYLRSPAEERGFHLLVPNLPGMGKTAIGAHQADYSQSNSQRVAFLSAFMDQTRPKVEVLVGHSSGATAAVGLLAREPWRARLLVLLNPVGFNPDLTYFGFRWPHMYESVIRAWNRSSTHRALTNASLYFLCRFVFGFRVESGEAGLRLAEYAAGMELDELGQAFRSLGQNRDLGVLVLFGGRDPILRPKERPDMASVLGAGPVASVASDAEALDLVDGRLGSGQRHSALLFPNDGHFCQKHRAALTVELAHRYLQRMDADE